MKCPIDTTVDLVLSERGGIEIDYCPTCRGVWLDRGELDKIIDRASQPAPRPTPMPTPAYTPEPAIASADDRRWKRDDDSDGYPRDGYPRKKRKRESFLGDLFDF